MPAWEALAALAMATVREMVRETLVTPANFIYPLFIHNDDQNSFIASMLGCERHSLASMVKEAKTAWALGVRSFILFPKVPLPLQQWRRRRVG